jgi:tetratricopeptide (TPR) repeat protein
MKTIFADFNAINAAGNFWLSCRGSERDIREAGVQVGDWIWLSDGELIVGARFAFDEVEGPIGVPRWNTLVHLDDEPSDYASVRRQFFQVLEHPAEPGAVERLYQLATILEVTDPALEDDSSLRDTLTARRVGALLLMQEPGLALVEVKRDLKAAPDNPDTLYVYLETLKLVDLDRAAREANDLAEASKVSPLVLAACIDILSAVANRLSDRDFQSVGPRIIDWVNRFEATFDLQQIIPSIRAGVLFNLGLAFLRLGRVEQARDMLGLAHAIDPSDPAIDAAARLEVYDDRARMIAAEFWERPPLIAA